MNEFKYICMTTRYIYQIINRNNNYMNQAGLKFIQLFSLALHKTIHI
jgi:hypothetical protein